MVHLNPPAPVLLLGLAAALVIPLAVSACVEPECGGQDASFRCSVLPETESLTGSDTDADTETDTDTDTDTDAATATDGGGSDGAAPAQDPPREDPKKAPR